MLNNGSQIEYVHITGKGTSPDITIERAKEGTTAISCTSGDSITVVNSAGMYEKFNQSGYSQTLSFSTEITTQQIVQDNSIGIGISDCRIAENTLIQIGNNSEWRLI